jgi:integrase
MSTKRIAGMVAVSENNGWLRIRLPRHPGVPEDQHGRFLGLGLKQSPINRARAEEGAAAISRAIYEGRYEGHWRQYFDYEEVNPIRSQVTVEAMVSNYLEWVSHTGIAKATVEDHRTALVRVIRLYSDKRVVELGVRDADKVFMDMSGLTPYTRKRYLNRLVRCWQWAIERNLAVTNPWTKLASSAKRGPSKKPEAFTKAETDAILAAFQNSHHHSYYYPLVLFSFITGVRPGEARALLWENVAADCSSVRIVDSLDRDAKPKGITKTAYSNRVLLLPLALSKLLQQRRPEFPIGLVFPSKTGKYLDINVFNHIAWLKMIVASGVRYLSPYHMRHTAITRWIEAGHNIRDVAKWAGTSVAMIQKHYLADGEALPIPDFQHIRL